MPASSRQPVIIDAPAAVVWELVGDPDRHSEWWPKVVESDCADPVEGCRYRRVEKSPFGASVEHEFTVERLEDCRELVIRCVDTGFLNRFLRRWLEQSLDALKAAAERGARA